MNPDRFDHIAALAVTTFNVPPAAVPREEIWARIRSARAVSAAPRSAHVMASPIDAAAEARVRFGGGDARIRSRGARRPTTAFKAVRRFVPVTLVAATALLSVFRLTDDASRGTANPAATGALPAFAVGAAAHWLEPQEFSGIEDGGFGLAASGGSDPWFAAAFDDPVSAAYRRAAVLHLHRSEAHLMAFAAMSDDSASRRRPRATSEELLSRTRLLLDSRATIGTLYRSVFLDLELVLMRMSMVTPETIQADRKLIKSTLERKRLLGRMRALLPGPVTSNAN